MFLNVGVFTMSQVYFAIEEWSCVKSKKLVRGLDIWHQNKQNVHTGLYSVNTKVDSSRFERHNNV